MEAEELTWREQEVLALLAQRFTNREIAARLHLAESTVKDYVSRILSKLYVRNRRQAVARGKELGLLGQEQKSTATPSTHLPAEPTPFVGRQDVLGAITDQLAKTRLLTLVGPGGIGKTRLALKLAADFTDKFRDGSFFVALAPLQSFRQIVQAIAEVLQIPLTTDEDPQQQLLRYLRNKHLFLVMDNYEHVLDGVALVSQILQAAPMVKILTTSRERLNLRSETVFTVEGMTIPNYGERTEFLKYDAIVLFIQSAQRVRRSFDSSLNELEQIAEICAIVQGVPLAIELAAAWLHILSLAEIAEELDRSFDLLSGELRDAPERHRSIRAVFEHTWFMLQPTEQSIFMILSVFRGGFTRNAAYEVAGATLPSLSGLVNKSILSFQPASGRFAMHELLRQYAQEQLAQSSHRDGSPYESHAAFYAQFMATSWSRLKGKGQTQALHDIEADLENVRAAWHFHVSRGDIPSLQRYINSFWLLYWLRGWNWAAADLFEQGIRVVETLPVNLENESFRAQCQASKAFFLTWLGLAEQGHQLAKESAEVLERLGHAEGLVLAYHSLTLADYYLEYVAEEREAAGKLFKIAQEMGDEWTLANALALSSLATMRAKDYEAARQLAEASLETSNRIGDLVFVIISTNTLGHLAVFKGASTEAKQCFLHCLRTAKEIGFHWAKGNATKYLGQVALRENELAEAETYFLQSLKIAYDLGLERDIVNHLYEFARLRIAQQREDEAITLLSLLLQQPASRQTRLGSGRIRDNALMMLEQLREISSPEVFSTALASGKTAVLDEKLAGLLNRHSSD